MERVPDPTALRGAAAVARSLAYVIGLLGVVGGAVVFRADNAIGLALAIWVITFAGGAMLMIAGFLCDGLAVLLGRTAAIEQELRTLRGPAPADDEPGPWTGHPNPW